MQFDYFAYTIASHYAPAIINDDWTGLEDYEVAELEAWMDEVSNKVDHWVVMNDVGFCTDEVTGLKSDCVTIYGYFKA
jgi:hypothetical protein